jgi:hypothetical protein
LRENGKPMAFKRLNRTPEQSFLVGLTWSNDVVPGKRIRQFPSWSWAGWSGKVRNKLMWGESWTTTLAVTKVRIEGDNGDLSEFPMLELLRNSDPKNPLGRQIFITIEGNTCACTTVQMCREDFPGLGCFGPDASWEIPDFVEVVGSNNTRFYFPVTWNRELEDNEQSGKKFTGILVGDLNSHDWGRIVMILVENLDGNFERVGISDCTYAIHKKLGVEKGAHDVFHYGPQKWNGMKIERRTIRLG